jgi:uncharacterized protein
MIQHLLTNRSLPGTILVTAAFLVVFDVLGSLSSGSEPRAVPVVAPIARPVNLSDVRLLDGPFKQSQDVHAKYLLSLAPGRLLARYRVEAGLPSGEANYPGWEDKELPGVAGAFYLSGCARMYAVTGDRRFFDRLDTLLKGLEACQKAQGDGYLLATRNGRRIFAELERGDIRLTEGWLVNGEAEPYYAMEKLFSGLRDAYRVAGQYKGLTIAVGLADWLDRHTAHFTDEQLQRIMSTEFGGINWVMADLYADTGNLRYLALSRRWQHKAILDPLAHGEDILPGKHANTQFPKISGLAARYPYSGDPFDRITAEFFWDRVAHHHSYVTGDNSLGESFGPPDRLNERLGPNTTESCNAWNMLRLTSLLFAIKPRADLADFAERVLWNHILPAQNHDDGRVCYFLPLASGYTKPYEPLYDRFACCTCSGLDSYARHADTIYYEAGDTLFVNQFIASEARWKGMAVRLETAIPDAGTARLTISCKAPRNFRLAVRCPHWASDGMKLKVNGTSPPVSGQPGNYIVLERQWKNDDAVEVQLPLPVHLETMPDNPCRIGFFKGPVLLAGDLGSSNAPILVTPEPPSAALLRPIKGTPSSYRLAGVGRPCDVTLQPFFRLNGQRYAVYWDVVTPKQWSVIEAERAAVRARKKALDDRTIDRVEIGVADSEAAHHLKFEHSNTGRGAYGKFMETRWRDAWDGWFSYELRIVPATEGELLCTFWGKELGARKCDVLIDGRKATTLTLDSSHPEAFYDVVIKIPSAWVQGKEHVTVRFQAHPGNAAGGLFDLRILKRMALSSL